VIGGIIALAVALDVARQGRSLAAQAAQGAT
jgi:hypothetical protein